MAKRGSHGKRRQSGGRHRQGGRVTPKGTHPRGFRAPHPDPGVGWAEPEPDLMGDVRRALADPHPLGLLALVSTLLAAIDPQRIDSFDRGQDHETKTPPREELLGSFIDVDRVETSALLAAIAAMTTDEVERRRLRRVLDDRTDALPRWLARLGDVVPYRAVEMSHVLGDGDNVMVGVRLPTGEELSAVVYIDHNLGTLVKDAFVVPEPISDVIAFMRSKNDDPDTTWADLDLADAGARITAAIERGAITFPPLETDTWPAARPLLEWVCRPLPEGGRGYERPEWSDDARQQLADRFFASQCAAGLDHPDYRDLLHTMIWFGCDYGPGDPLRWSPVAIEILLGDWIPRKIAADVAYLAKAPALLRRFVEFCHRERGIRPTLTAQTLAAIDDWEPDYQATIRAPRPQGPEALLVAMGALDPDGPWPMPGAEPLEFEEIMLDALRRAVGGADALAALDDAPLPDEPFAWDGIAADIQDRVAEILALCDSCCDELLDVEHRTACRRLLARAATGDPPTFRRKARADTAAAAVCWIIGKANELFTPSGGMLVKDLMSHFGLQQGGVSQRARTLLKAAGINNDVYGEIALGSPELLVSMRRHRIIERRDRYTS